MELKPPRLIASTVFHNGKIRGIIVGVTHAEYEYYMEHDVINENQVSITCVKQYLNEKGYPDEIAKEKISKAYAGEIAFWKNAYVITIPNLKEVLHIVDENLIYHDFIDAYCQHLKSI
jgi:hypothetical protein